MSDELREVPIVSVIVGVLNGVGSVAATLDAALSQQYRSLEVIVVDGGSTDGTRAVVEGYASRLGAFVSEKDSGIGDAWNKGIALCKGQFIAILNAGDLWPTDFISKHMETLAADPFAIQYGTTYMTREGQIVSRMDRKFDPEHLIEGFGFLHTSVMTSKCVYDCVGPFDVAKRIAVDSDWLLRALKMKVPFRSVHVHNYMAEGGVSSKHWLKGQLEYLDSLRSAGVPFEWHAAVRRKRAQSIYLRLGLSTLKRRARMQLALATVAALNAFSKAVPFHFPRRMVWACAGLKLSPQAVVHQGVQVLATKRLTVGAGSVLNRGTLIDNRCQVTIGCHVSIAHECRIYTTGHDYQSPDFRVSTKPVHIEDYAVLFAGAVVMPGVTVGRGAVVLPFSVVTKDVAPLSVVGGQPAVVRGQRAVSPNYKLDYAYWFAV
jgi:acetyltransferase-like isoleucine patch superfamily enzyme/glycosyltransferase involved in cell wall biosynthesis